MIAKKFILSTTVCKCRLLVFSMIVPCMVVLFLTACSNPEAEAKIANLTAQNAELSQQIQNLQKKLDSVSAESAVQRKTLDDLDFAK